MARSLALVFVFTLSAVAGIARAQTDTRPVILALDDARVGQQRYLIQLLKLPRMERLTGSTEHLTDPNAESCRAETLERSESCLRDDNATETFDRPVLVLADAPTNDSARPGLADLVCVGHGAQPSDPERQRISLWPTAFTLHSAKPFIADGEALEGCIAAAIAETDL